MKHSSSDTSYIIFTAIVISLISKIAVIEDRFQEFERCWFCPGLEISFNLLLFLTVLLGDNSPHSCRFDLCD